ncbi:MAG: aminopeptidase P family protein [Firmicutes bacterium]|nr:aminopeptidase P family protein [Bacillota bacterium]
MAAHLEKIRDYLKFSGLDALIITKPQNSRYLSGFAGEGLLLITSEKALLLTDFRYIQQAGQQAPEYQVVRTGTPPVDTLVIEIVKAGVKKVGFESEHVTVKELSSWREKTAGVSLEPREGVVEKIRMVKGQEEQNTLRRAVEIADQAFKQILKKIIPGVTEREIALELEFIMKRAGAEKLGFDTILASGPRGALPHGVASDRVIAAGDLVTMDFGCFYKGYTSDMTRTVAVGQAADKQKEIYSIVLEAQLAGLGAVRAGMRGSEVDAVARRVIADAGYGEYFGHGLGHGVGLEIHEAPRLAPSDDTLLAPGMVVTVEPGIYIPDWGGVRIEDMVVVTDDGCEVLTGSTKELICL